MEEKYSKEEAKTIRTGVVAFVMILFIVILTISHNANIEGKGLGGKYNIYASFGRTDGLNVGDAVRMSGVDIGRVVASKLDEDFNSRLTLEINNEYKIPDDSSASIISFGLIGGKYIEIEVGGSEDFIPANGSISYTQDSIVLEELLDRIISMGKSKKTNTSEVIDEKVKGEFDE